MVNNLFGDFIFCLCKFIKEHVLDIPEIFDTRIYSAMQLV